MNGLGHELGSNYSLPFGLTMSEFLTVVEDGVRKYSHLSKKEQFVRCRADLKRARRAELSRLQSMGGKQTGDGGTG